MKLQIFLPVVLALFILFLYPAIMIQTLPKFKTLAKFVYYDFLLTKYLLQQYLFPPIFAL
jgi:hypothetical protein